MASSPTTAADPGEITWTALQTNYGYEVPAAGRTLCGVVSYRNPQWVSCKVLCVVDRDGVEGTLAMNDVHPESGHVEDLRIGVAVRIRNPRSHYFLDRTWGMSVQHGDVVEVDTAVADLERRVASEPCPSSTCIEASCVPGLTPSEKLFLAKVRKGRGDTLYTSVCRGKSALRGATYEDVLEHYFTAIDFLHCGGICDPTGGPKHVCVALWLNISQVCLALEEETKRKKTRQTFVFPAHLFHPDDVPATHLECAEAAARSALAQGSTWCHGVYRTKALFRIARVHLLSHRSQTAWDWAQEARVSVLPAVSNDVETLIQEISSERLREKRFTAALMRWAHPELRLDVSENGTSKGVFCLPGGGARMVDVWTGPLSGQREEGDEGPGAPTPRLVPRTVWLMMMMMRDHLGRARLEDHAPRPPVWMPQAGILQRVFGEIPPPNAKSDVPRRHPRTVLFFDGSSSPTTCGKSLHTLSSWCARPSRILLRPIFSWFPHFNDGVRYTCLDTRRKVYDTLAGPLGDEAPTVCRVLLDWSDAEKETSKRRLKSTGPHENGWAKWLPHVSVAALCFAYLSCGLVNSNVWSGWRELVPTLFGVLLFIGIGLCGRNGSTLRDEHHPPTPDADWMYTNKNLLRSVGTIFQRVEDPRQKGGHVRIPSCPLSLFSSNPHQVYPFCIAFPIRSTLARSERTNPDLLTRTIDEILLVLISFLLLVGFSEDALGTRVMCLMQSLFPTAQDAPFEGAASSMSEGLPASFCNMQEMRRGEGADFHVLAQQHVSAVSRAIDTCLVDIPNQSSHSRTSAVEKYLVKYYGLSTWHIEYCQTYFSFSS